MYIRGWEPVMMKRSVSAMIFALACLTCLESLEAKSIGHLAVVPAGTRPPEGAIELPAGMKVPARDVAEATQHARRTGRPVLVPLDESALSPAAKRQLAGKLGKQRRREEERVAPESLSLNPAAETKEREMERHRQRATRSSGGSGDVVTGDGARPTRQPVDEVSKLLGMLPYALGILLVAVGVVVFMLARLSKFLAPDASSYFDKSGNQSSHRVPPKMRGGFGRRY